MNAKWKQAVRDALENNKKLRKGNQALTDLTNPRSHTELAEAIRHIVLQRPDLGRGAPDSSSISLMLGRQRVSKLVDATSAVLGIPQPSAIVTDDAVVAEAPDDEPFEAIIAKLSGDQRETALRLLRELLPPGDRDRALRVIRALIDADR